MDGNIKAGDLLRIIGFFGIAIGIAWAVQTVGMGHDELSAKLMWVVAAASMSGAGVGLVLASAGFKIEFGARRVRA